MNDSGGRSRPVPARLEGPGLPGYDSDIAPLANQPIVVTIELINLASPSLIRGLYWAKFNFRSEPAAV
jgi:hypothetical protein